MAQDEDDETNHLSGMRTVRISTKDAQIATQIGRRRSGGSRRSTEVNVLQSRTLRRLATITSVGDDLVLGHFRILDSPPLGEGGWCKVVCAENLHDLEHGKVAIKTFHKQAMKSLGPVELGRRFATEIATFRSLGVSLKHGAEEEQHQGFTPRDVFVNLLDFSGVGLAAGAAADGCFYSVLELGDETFNQWLEHRSSVHLFLSLVDLQGLARCLAAALTWMGRRGLCHFDIKPANIMHFGDTWKLIDLEGAVPLTATTLSLGCFTPLYACPELGRAVLDDPAVVAGTSTELQGISPSGKMDVWGAGVVLLDAMAHECALQETYSSFQVQAMMEFDFEAEEGGIGFQKDWYEWLTTDEPIKASDYGISSSRALLEASGELRDMMARLLAKDPVDRLTAEEFLQHPFLSTPPPGAGDSDEDDACSVATSVESTTEATPMQALQELQEVREAQEESIAVTPMQALQEFREVREAQEQSQVTAMKWGTTSAFVDTLSAKKSEKVCDRCSRGFQGYGRVCGNCRRNSNQAIIRQCAVCSDFFKGFAEVCHECGEAQSFHL